MGALPAFTFITDNLAIGGLMAYAQPYELAQFHTILSVAAEFGDGPQKAEEDKQALAELSWLSAVLSEKS